MSKRKGIVAAELNVVSEQISTDKKTQDNFLEEAYACYASALKGYLMRTVSPLDAEDLMQEVFLRMARHKDLAQIDNLQAFMYTTATNLLRDRWRRNNAKYAPTMVSCDDVLLEAGATDPAEIVEWQESLEKVAREIERLKEKPRCAFELSRIHGRSYIEIAKHMSVSVSMIEKHISCTLTRLRQATI